MRCAWLAKIAALGVTFGAGIAPAATITLDPDVADAPIQLTMGDADRVESPTGMVPDRATGGSTSDYKGSDLLDLDQMKLAPLFAPARPKRCVAVFCSDEN